MTQKGSENVQTVKRTENASTLTDHSSFTIDPLKISTLNEITFFDRLKKALRTQQVFENFLKCLALFNQDIITRSELIELVEPFLGKFANLYRWFKDYVENKPMSNVALDMPLATTGSFETIGEQKAVQGGKGRVAMPSGTNYSLEIDYLSCKQYGASYRDISSYPQPISSGQTELCKQVIFKPSAFN